jgi:O-acetyl-ADP-ribose deacetylase (regulator of RNase III)
VEKHGIKTAAFPAISTGVYAFPKERAARIAVRETKDFLERDRSVEKVILVYFGASALEIYKTALCEAELL